MARTFAEAWAEGGLPTPQPPPEQPPQTPTPARREATDEPLVDPRDGQIIDIANAPSEQLVDVVLECRRREGLEQTWRRACEDELKRRMGDRKVAVFGSHEVKVDTGRGKEWDGQMLRAVLTDLVADHVITAGEIPDDLIKPPQVNGTAANRLLDRLQGEHREMVEECFRWVQKSRPRVTIAPVPDLANTLPETG